MLEATAGIWRWRRDRYGPIAYAGAIRADGVAGRHGYVLGHWVAACLAVPAYAAASCATTLNAVTVLGATSGAAGISVSRAVHGARRRCWVTALKIALSMARGRYRLVGPTRLR